MIGTKQVIVIRYDPEVVHIDPWGRVERESDAATTARRKAEEILRKLRELQEELPHGMVVDVIKQPWPELSQIREE